MNVIECNGIVKQFGNYRALDNVSIAVPEGKIFGLLGPNGAGKTTLIRIINQITIPDAGQVYFGGKEAQPDDVYNIGYLPEERGLYKKMKVGEQAMYLARLKGMTSAQAEKELKKWFVKFGIQSWWGKKVEELSKGMAQKVQFITTVLHQPKLLILDEPFSGFDPVNAQLISDEILALKANGTSIILSTHNMESVEALCDEIALINKSKLIVTGGVDEIRREHGQNQVELIYRGSEPLPLKESEFVLNAYDEEFKGNRRAIIEMERDVKSGAVLADILKQTQDIISFKELIPSMNDIFIKLVSGEAK
ncbi:MAG: ATP-binding cassette domain-containing protein [Bacteroidales bacterium]|nr:ATP-binding cassette domain-containing protein [Bacteroidales bacterium]